jgi:uncharacterized protein (TIGR03435 family)
LRADAPALGKMTFEQRRTMFQSILADRFKLVVRHQTRELPIYVLSVAKGGPKLKPSAPDNPVAPAPRRMGLMITRGKVTANDTQLSTLVTVLSRKEQLGLKLDSAKGPVDVVVIDHIEKPAEN